MKGIPSLQRDIYALLQSNQIKSPVENKSELLFFKVNPIL